MGFLNPLFWLGVAALAAPVLVHLVKRTRARRVEFPTLHFVRQVPQRTIRRRTIHNILLLILRCLAMLLIVIAFTRPFFSTGSASAGGQRTLASIVLIDASLSMRRGEHFAEAKRRAEAVINAARADESVAIIAFGKGYEIACRFTTDKNQARAALASLNAGFDGTDYERALRGAESLFNELKTVGAKRIFLITDFQATGWNQAAATFKLRNDVQLATIDVGSGEAANVALTDVEARATVYERKYTDKVAVHVSNFGLDAAERLTLNFQINDQTVEKREVSLAGRDSKVVEFTGFNLAEGVNRCTVSVSAEDFEHDNQFYFTLKREAPAKALIVDRAVRGRAESFYLQSALATEAPLPFSFSVKSAGSVDPADIPNYSLIVLNDTGALPPGLVESLQRFVEAGGNAIIAAGSNTEAGDFNQAFQRITPATLNEVVRLERGDSTAITDVKTDHPIFEVFHGGGRLLSGRVFGYNRSEPRAGASVLARFEDGSPALVEASVGLRGRVLLFTSTLGTGWTDMPLTPSYLPFVQQMIRYLGERESAAWHMLGQTFTVEKAPEESVLPAVDTPAGARLMENRLTPDGGLLVTGREPGFYRLRYSARPEFAAVNVDGNEGNFDKLNVDEFLAAVTGGEQAPQGVTANNNLSDIEVEARQRVWWPLLCIALLLFVAESLIARRTKIVKMIG
jgi:hypothetical protein